MKSIQGFLPRWQNGLLCHGYTINDMVNITKSGLISSRGRINVTALGYPWVHKNKNAAIIPEETDVVYYGSSANTEVPEEMRHMCSDNRVAFAIFKIPYYIDLILNGIDTSGEHLAHGVISLENNAEGGVIVENIEVLPPQWIIAHMIPKMMLSHNGHIFSQKTLFNLLSGASIKDVYVDE